MSTIQPLNSPAASANEPPRFLTPAEVARMFRVSKMTIYRAIRDGDLPAVPMRGRWAVPVRAIIAMESTALAQLGIAESAINDRDVGEEIGRPRAGANQTGAGSPVTQHRAREDVSSMPDGELPGTGRGRSSGGVR